MAAPTTEGVPAAEEAASPPRAGLVIAILFLIFFLASSDNQMISPLLPKIASDFGMDQGALGSLIGPSYALAAAFAALVIGPLSDRHGRRRFLLYSTILFGVSLLSVRLISSPVALAGGRLLTGLAAGTFSTCSIAYVGDYFPYKRRAVAMSVVQAGYFAALAVGIQIANTLASWRGWRLGFEAFGLMSAVAFLFVLLGLPEDKHHHQQDAQGERRLANIRIVFEQRDRVASIAAAFFVSGGFVGFFFYLGSWLIKNLAFGTRDMNITFLLIGVALLLGVIGAGPMSNRFGKRGLSIGSTVALALFLFLIPLLERGLVLYGMLMLAALAFALRQGPLQALATELVPRQARGTLVSARNTASQIGIAAATAASGPLFDQVGYQGVGIFSGTLTLAAAVCITMMPEPKSEHSK
jgi:predicted MFS family arabinose efflux permease